MTTKLYDTELFEAATKAWSEQTDASWSSDGMMAAVMAVRDAVEAAVHAERPTNSDACEAIARMLVPYWYGGFELQDVDRETGVWRKPPGTPNDRAYEIADKVLAIVGRSSPAEKEMEASDAPVWYGPDEASAWANGYNAGAARRSQPVTDGYRTCPADGDKCLCDDTEALGCFSAPGSRLPPTEEPRG